MKKLFYLFVTILLQSSGIISFAQLKEVDEKKEFIGLTFLSLPDYSTLNYFKPGPDFNLYELKTPRSFTTAEYSISKIYITIKKGRVMDFICVIDSDKDYENIVKELKNTFPTQVEVKNNTTFHGKNIIFLPQKNNTQKTLFIATGQPDTIPDIKDNSGIIDLLDKPFSDEAVQHFVTSIPGKYKKKKLKYGFELIWEKSGVYMFVNSNNNVGIISIVFNPFFENYGIKEKFTALIPLPYGITENTNPYQLIDMFGKPDIPDQALFWPRFNKYKIEAEYFTRNSPPVSELKIEQLTFIKKN